MDLGASDAHGRVLEMTARGQADQDTLAAWLSPGERAARGELHAWSAGDHIAHNNFWRQDALNRLTAARDGSTPPAEVEDEDAQNDRTFEAQRDTPWDALVAETGRLRAETDVMIEQLSADQVARQEILVFINWYDHPAEHWTDVYLRRGEVDRAIELRRAVAATARDLLGHRPERYGYMLDKVRELCAAHDRPLVEP